MSLKLRTTVGSGDFLGNERRRKHLEGLSLAKNSEWFGGRIAKAALFR
jgi:hypothetical protein